MTGSTDDELWPAVGRTAVLTWGTTGHASAEVQQAGQDVLRVLRTAGAAPPPIGTPMQLEWSGSGGLLVRPARLQVVWHNQMELQAEGAAERTQRRRFYRAATVLAAVMRNRDGRFDAFTLDLSEAGVRLRVTGQSPGPASEITTDLVLEGTRISLPGRVVRHGPTLGGVDLGVAFEDLPRLSADALRRKVFNEQLAVRRQGTWQ